MKMEKEQSPIVKFYLFLYNLVQFFGWSAILVGLGLHFAEGGNFATSWAAIGNILLVFQNAAVLEIFHVLFGMVKAPPSTTIIQVFSRIFLTSVIAYHFPESRENWGFTSMVVSWGLTEVIRYSYYALNIYKRAPYFLLWLRYTTFLVLYPTGAGSEVILLYKAFPLAKATHMFSIEMPNSLNFGFSFYYALVVLILLYIPGLPKMYGHMITQRKRSLYPKTD